MDLREFDIYGDYDFYDHEKLEKLNKKRSMELLNLYKKIRTLREKGDEKAITKIRLAIIKHEEITAELKKKAAETYYYWY